LPCVRLFAVSNTRQRPGLSCAQSTHTVNANHSIPGFCRALHTANTRHMAVRFSIYIYTESFLHVRVITRMQRHSRETSGKETERKRGGWGAARLLYTNGFRSIASQWPVTGVLCTCIFLRVHTMDNDY
jgi:hypothetical protein